jgi:hypothetical protein
MSARASLKTGPLLLRFLDYRTVSSQALCEWPGRSALGWKPVIQEIWLFDWIWAGNRQSGFGHLVERSRHSTGATSVPVCDQIVPF